MIGFFSIQNVIIRKKNVATHIYKCVRVCVVVDVFLCVYACVCTLEMAK